MYEHTKDSIDAHITWVQLWLMHAAALWTVVQVFFHLAAYRNQAYFVVVQFFAFVPIFRWYLTTSYRNQKRNYFLIWIDNYDNNNDNMDDNYLLSIDFSWVEFYYSGISSSFNKYVCIPIYCAHSYSFCAIWYVQKVLRSNMYDVVYLAMACFDVDGGSSSSHGHTDTETVAFSPVLMSSSHGHTAQAAWFVTNVVSKCSAINFVASLCKQA